MQKELNKNSFYVIYRPLQIVLSKLTVIPQKDRDTWSAKIQATIRIIFLNHGNFKMNGLQLSEYSHQHAGYREFWEMKFTLGTSLVRNCITVLKMQVTQNYNCCHLVVMLNFVVQIHTVNTLLCYSALFSMNQALSTKFSHEQVLFKKDPLQCYLCSLLLLLFYYC